MVCSALSEPTPEAGPHMSNPVRIAIVVACAVALYYLVTALPRSVATG